MYMLNQMEPESTNYNMPGALIIEGELDESKITHAFEAVIERNEILRTSFEIVDGKIMQKVNPEVSFKVEIQKGNTDDITTYMKEFIKPFDLSQAPLLRVQLIQLAPNKSILCYDMHHIISDGISTKLFIEQFIKYYKNEILPQPKIQYKDYAMWQVSEQYHLKLEQQERYWLEQFKDDIPILSFPTDYPRKVVRQFEGKTVYHKLNQEVVNSLKQLQEATGATYYMILLATYNILLYKYTGQESFVIGSPIAGRNHKDVQDIMGMFVNTLALKNQVTYQMTFRNFLKDVVQNTLEAFEHQDYPLEYLIEKLGLNKELSHNPLFDTMFVMQNIDDAVIDLEGLKVREYKFDDTVSKFDITLQVLETQQDITLGIQYCTGLFKEETIQKMLSHYEVLLKQLLNNPDQTLDKYSMMTEEEQVEILQTFSQSSQMIGSQETIHRIFEQQVQKQPHAIALINDGNHVTYEALNKKANQIAHSLIKEGIQPKEVVGVMLETSIELVATFLGILKAGGAYLPIDPTYPLNRIEYILENSGVQLLITNSTTNQIDCYTGKRINVSDASLLSDNYET